MGKRGAMPASYETGRLLLRELDEGQAEAVRDYFLRNRRFLEQWEAARSDAYFTVEAQREQLEKDRRQREAGGLLRLWIFKKGEPARIIGSLAFANIVRGAFQSCHLGYRLDEAELNRGYATEAIGRGIAVMFADQKLHRIEANVMPRNHPSLRVLEKLGFSEEGRARKYLKINGRWEDHIHMVLLNEEV